MQLRVNCFIQLGEDATLKSNVERTESFTLLKDNRTVELFQLRIDDKSFEVIAEQIVHLIEASG